MQATSDNKVSLVIPVKNESGSIGILLDSIAKQSKLPDEIIFVDGGSSDTTPLIIEAYAKRLRNIRLIRLKKAFPGEGRNEGVKIARFNIIAFTDAGIRLAPDWLNEISYPLQQDLSVDVVYGHYEPQVDSWFKQCSAIAYVPVADMLVDGLVMRHHSIVSMVIRRNVWEITGGFLPLRSGEDLLFMDHIKSMRLKEAYAPNAKVKWDIPPDLKSTYHRFRLYAKWGIIAKKTHTWHWRIFAYYMLVALLTIILFNISPSYALIPFIAMILFRTIKQIIRNRFFQWFYKIRLDCILGVAVIILVIDIATLIGAIDWFTDKKLRRIEIAT